MTTSIHSSVTIHPTAIIEEGAVIGEGTVVGPYSIIRSTVTIGKDNNIGPHVVIEGDTNIGDGNQFYQFASVGSIPQVIKWQGGKSKLIIGNNNIFREFITIQPGLEQAGGVTKVGDNNLFMIACHVGHDCIIGDHNRFTNYVGVSGHVVIGNHAIIGGFSGVHQFVQVGDYAFVGAGSIVTMDVPPFCTAQGNHATLVQINNVGLARQGFTDAEIAELKTIFRKLFYIDGLFQDKLEALSKEYVHSVHANNLFNFIKGSKRGICGYQRKANKADS
ncbi:MAG: UDP-N-acetylglucosamine acyltransferase [Rickettsiaceae bacterium]|nr:UDP-N-acetylglucosamine acyltransferase [Rickettsiaceae bacterium]